MVTGNFVRGRLCRTAAEAYHEADSWYAGGAARVSIHLVTGCAREPDGVISYGSEGMADARKPDENAGEWVVGLARWESNQQRAIDEGRA